MIEVLTATSLIAVLLAILFPVFAGVRARASQTVSLSNVRSIGTAIHLYSADYDDFFPRAMTFPYLGDTSMLSEEQAEELPLLPHLKDTLGPYAKSNEIYRSPNDSGSQVMELDWPAPVDASPSLFEAAGSSYIYRVALGSASLSSSSLEDPSSLGILMSGAGHWGGNASAASADDTTEAFNDKVKSYRYSAAFGDGRAQSISFEKAQTQWNSL